MSAKFSFGNVGVSLGASLDEQSQAQAAPRERSSRPFRVLFLGDFSGRANRGATSQPAEIAQRRAVAIDRDNFDDVLARHAAEIDLTLSPDDEGPAETLSLKFAELDDFHPDRLVPSADVFARLRQLRRRLQDTKTFAEAAAELRPDRAEKRPAPPEVPAKKPEATSAPAAPAEPGSPSGGDLLGSLLEETQRVASTAPQPSRAGGTWDRLIQSIVAPYALEKPNPEQAELVEMVDRATADVLRRLLHAPEFQELEAAWRALHLLVRRVETDAQLQLHVLDLSRAEIEADLRASDDLGQSGLYKLLVEQTVATPGGLSWALVVGNFTFDHTVADAELLGRLARIAAAAGAPLLAGGHSRLVGCESFAATPDPDDWRTPDGDVQEAWTALRGLAEARSVSLAMPRILLRIPYGTRTSPIQPFRFEEFPDRPLHEALLWGNGAFACALAICEVFTRDGWAMRPERGGQIEGLPLYAYKVDGESQVYPCAEAELSDRAAGRMGASGLVALQSIRNQGAVLHHGVRGLGLEPQLDRRG